MTQNVANRKTELNYCVPFGENPQVTFGFTSDRSVLFRKKQSDQSAPLHSSSVIHDSPSFSNRSPGHLFRNVPLDGLFALGNLSDRD